MSKLFYSKLAQYYDKIYHYIGYEQQVKLLIEIIKEFSASQNNALLDVACGTGTQADLLQKQGFQVTGLDISPEMLAEARKKNSQVKFIQGDMKELNLNEKFGTIICFFNSILYNKNKSEMITALTHFYNHLEDGGLLVFDAVDRSTGLILDQEEYNYEVEGLKISFKPQWIYNKEKNVLDLEIDFIVNGEKMHDHHEMGAFSFEELAELLENIGFTVQILEHNFDAIQPYNSGSDEAVFVCKK